MSDWQALDLSNPSPAPDVEPEEVEIEVEQEELNDIEGKHPESGIESADVSKGDQEEEETQSEASSEEQKPRKKKRRSRAQERIRELAKERDAERRAREDYEQRLKEFETRFETIEKSNSTAQFDQQINSISSQIDTLKAQYASALEESNSNRAAEINVELNELMLQRKIAEAEKVRLSKVAETPVKSTETEEKPKQQPQQYPPAFEDWLDNNYWFAEPDNASERRLQRFVNRRAAELMDEGGYDFTMDELYDEIDKEVKKFTRKHNLKIDGLDTQEGEEEKTMPKKAPVASNNRGTNVTRGADGRVKVKLTASQIEMAKRLNLTNEQYARELMKMQKQQKAGESPYYNILEE